MTVSINPSANPRCAVCCGSSLLAQVSKFSGKYSDRPTVTCCLLHQATSLHFPTLCSASSRPLPVTSMGVVCNNAVSVTIPRQLHIRSLAALFAMLKVKVKLQVSTTLRRIEGVAVWLHSVSSYVVVSR